jgi:hypothetical protein
VQYLLLCQLPLFFFFCGHCPPFDHVLGVKFSTCAVCSQTGEEDFDLAKVVGYKQDMKIFY